MCRRCPSTLLIRALCAWMFKLTAVAFRSTCPAAPAMPNEQAASRLRGDNAAALPNFRQSGGWWWSSSKGEYTWVSFSRWPGGTLQFPWERDHMMALARLEFRAVALKAVWRWKALVRRRRQQRAASWLQIVFFRGKPQQLQSQSPLIAAFVVRPFPGSQVRVGLRAGLW